MGLKVIDGTPTAISEYLRENEEELTLCNYDKERCCNCMTKSIPSKDGTHMVCGKCGATK